VLKQETLELGHWRVVLDPGEGASQQAFSGNSTSRMLDVRGRFALRL
jgi:hypothetical protein